MVELLTLKQACKILSCHPNTLRSWENQGKVTSIRLGSRRDRRFREAEIRSLLKEEEIDSSVLPSTFDLSRIDMTGTIYEGLQEEVLEHFKGYNSIGKEVIPAFDFKAIVAMQIKNIEYLKESDFFKDPTPADKILHIITSKRYRNGTIETIKLEKYKPQFIEKINYFIKNKMPIHFMLPAFPFKIANPLKSSRRDADLAEIGAFCRFNEINLQIKKIYSPGAKFVVFHDGHLYYKHFLHEKADADRYFDSLKKFVKDLGLSKVIEVRDAFEELKQIKDFDKVYPKAREDMTLLWKKDKLNNEKIQSIIRSSKNNLNLSYIPYELLYKINFSEDYDLTADEKKIKQEINERSEKCAFEYMVVQHALEKAGFFDRRVPHGLRLTVHPKEGQLGTYLVRRKTYLLPWMGVGVLKNTGEISVHYESELISSGKYFPVFIKGEKYPFYYKEAEVIYQGEEEFRKLFDSIAENISKDDFYWAFAFNSEYLHPKVREILLDIHNKLQKKSIEDKAICRPEALGMIKATYKDNRNIKIKAVKEEIPTGVIILKDRIINLLWGEQPSAYEIRTKEIVKKYQRYFKELWK